MNVPKLSLVLGIALVFICFKSSCAQDDFNSAVSEVFGNEEPKSPETQNEENLVSCQCVPFYLCKNNTISEYGEEVIDIRFGESDCEHYLDKCCVLPGQPPIDENIKPTPPPVPLGHTCGSRNADGIGFKITGASENEANYAEFPWMVAVLRRDHIHEDVKLKVMECGGSIIHPQVILTGAHCVKGKKTLYVRAGEWDTQTEKELYPTQERDVKQIIIHEKYYAGGLHNDVALLVLESPLELTSVIDTICLPDQSEDMNGRSCVVTGWGKDVFGKEGKYQVILKKVEQPTIPYGPCLQALRKTRLGPLFKLHESFLCAGGQIGKDACKGDGGGPLVCPSKGNPNVYVQAGIVAWGIGCGTETPAVYVNVPHFRTWIDNKIASLNLS